MNFQNQDDTICAVSTASGKGAIALIRLSGRNSISITEKFFSKELKDKDGHTAHFGIIRFQDQIIDEVLVTIFKNKSSFTGEEMVEIACHGSSFIQEQILDLVLTNGGRMASPGEFSLRAFLNGKMDLSQTEAIADLISAGSKAAHNVAMNQMRGGFSSEIMELRQKLMDFASLVELELDFSQEDVEFADREELYNLVRLVKEKVERLVDSFKLGNVIKNGVPVAIVGSPNAGKSTLLNSLLNENKAIVSNIPGTTRDVIEDTIVLDGIQFRFIDTAGIRDTNDVVELLGIEKALEQIHKAEIVLLIFDLQDNTVVNIIEQIETFREKQIKDSQTLISLFNKSDQVDIEKYKALNEIGLFISAKDKEGIAKLKEKLVQEIDLNQNEDQNIVTNVRHHDILRKCFIALGKVEDGLDNQIPGDLLAMDIRECLNLLGEISGNISSDELLGNIFSNFCIGK